MTCEHCGGQIERHKWPALRYRKRQDPNARSFCGRRCSGLGRRVNRTLTEKRAAKADYDKAYRETYAERLRARRRAYHVRTYDPTEARRKRKKRSRWHVEYCRRYYSDPRRKAEKVAYDQARRADSYREYAEAYKLLLLLKAAVRKACPDAYERRKQRGYYDWVNAVKRERRRHEKEDRQATRL